MKRGVRIFTTPQEMAEAFASDLMNFIKNAGNRQSTVTIALSGGNTPKLLFKVLADQYTKSVDWSYVHFFWGDERCVLPEDPESNYGMAYKFFLAKIALPEVNLHRIRCEENPEKEALRYSVEIINNTRSRDRLPVFDIIILGLGDDGHTASIFPNNLKLLDSDNVCEVAVHPVSGQKRITITGRVINNADNVFFLVTGLNKANIIEDIFKQKEIAVNYPASHIIPSYGNVSWLLDEKSGKFIN